MMDQHELDISYLRMAAVWGDNSRCTRKQVGCLVVRDGSIIADGFNGTPSGMDNACEGGDGETLWYTLHAESNAICKLAKNGGGSDGATIYSTLSPCRECSKLILQCGIKRVVCGKSHSDQTGPELLRSNGVEVVLIPAERWTR